MPVLGITELADLETQIKDLLDDRLLPVLTKLNRTGRLDELLNLLDMPELIQGGQIYQAPKNGKILVIGRCDVKQNVLAATAQSIGLDKSRFEFELEYDSAKTYNFKKLQYNPLYSAILVGPMPHSGTIKGDSGSIIASLEKEEGYPRIVRLGKNSLKISKTDFKHTLLELMENGLIE